MVQPGESTTKAVRAVFFIDPRIIRTIIYYPVVGTQFQELKRVLIGLQTADKFGVALLPIGIRRRCYSTYSRFLRKGKRANGR